MNINNIVESIINRASVFKNRSVLDRSYVPERLPHRDRQLALLAELFKPTVTSPGSISITALLVGDIGVGKTVTAYVFGRELVKVAEKKGIELRYIHVNCHSARTLYGVVQSIAAALSLSIPFRGLSPREMMLIVLNHMKKHNLHALITLDEFNYFVQVAGNDAVYFLIRLYDEYPEAEKRLHYILITRSLEVLGSLDPATESYITKHIIKFDPYKTEELFDILKQRRDLAFYENTVNDEILKYIAETEGYDKGGRGNARAAIEILLRAGIIADYEGSPYIKIEHVRKAIGEIREELLVDISDNLQFLQLHELMLLKAIIRKLRSSGEGYIKIGEAEEEYSYLCNILKIKPRKHTQVYEYIRNLKNMGIINAKISGKGFRGRTTLISIPVPLDPLEKRVDELIDKRLVEKEVNTI
ncbi:MAG: ORC1-type DNA replication protein [archaeon YNP-WB-062]|jgi:cell division control protein 6|nr:ORC1-type DNA replication protein [Candidatus Culexarchaeum yellowstonense]